MTDLVAFLGVAAIVIATPGQDTALTIRNVLIGYRAMARLVHVVGYAIDNAADSIGRRNNLSERF